MIRLKIFRDEIPSAVEELDNVGLGETVRAALSLIECCNDKLRDGLAPTSEQLGTRGMKLCMKLGIVDLRQFGGYTAAELLDQKNCGETTLKKIRQVLALYDLKLKGD